jgi:hypothetical protein
MSIQQRYIAGDAKRSKPLTSILTDVKQDHQRYGDTTFSRSGINQMWILKNLKDLLKTLSSRSQYLYNSIKIFDLST